MILDIDVRIVDDKPYLFKFDLKNGAQDKEPYLNGLSCTRNISIKNREWQKIESRNELLNIVKNNHKNTSPIYLEIYIVDGSKVLYKATPSISFDNDYINLSSDSLKWQRVCSLDYVFK